MTGHHYLPRAFGLLESGVFVQGTPYQAGQGKLSAAGVYGDRPFEDLNQLAALAEWSQPEVTAFVTRIQQILST